MRLSASSLQRASLCPASVVLPRVDSVNPDSTRGTDVHSFLERAARIGRDRALATVNGPETHDFCAALRLEELPVGPPYRQEVAWAYDVLTGKAWELGESLDRNYPPLQDWQIVGTCDAVLICKDYVEIIDWKVGFGHDLHTAPIRENKQLRALALMAARAADAERAIINIVYLPEHRVDTHTLDVFELAAIAAELKDLYERVLKTERARRAGATLNVRTGLHCRFCPALIHCPSTQALATQLVSVPGTIERDTKALLTADNAPLAYERWRQMKAVTDAVGNALGAWARENPIQTTNGNVYGPVATEREHLNGNVVFRVIEQLHGRGVATKACEMETSRAAIQRAIKPAVAKGEAAGAMRRVLQAVEADGGLTTTKGERLMEYRPEGEITNGT
jgi:hypothetical protein